MIARNPKSKDAKASDFIGRGDKNGAAGKLKLVSVEVNFDRELLERINAMAKAMGLNRSSFIINAVAEKLRQLEQK